MNNYLNRFINKILKRIGEIQNQNQLVNEKHPKRRKERKVHIRTIRSTCSKI